MCHPHDHLLYLLENEACLLEAEVVVRKRDLVVLALVMSVCVCSPVFNENVHGTRADLRLRRLLSSNRAVIYLRSRMHQCYEFRQYDFRRNRFAFAGYCYRQQVGRRPTDHSHFRFIIFKKILYLFTLIIIVEE